MIRQFLKDTEVAAAVGQSRCTPWRHVQEGLLPPPVRLSAGCTRWIASEVEAVQRARIAGADDKAIRALVRDLVAARQHKAAA